MVGEKSLKPRQRAYAVMSKAEQISRKAKNVFNTPPYHTRDLNKYHDPYLEKKNRQYEEDMEAYNKMIRSIKEQA